MVGAGRVVRRLLPELAGRPSFFDAFAVERPHGIVDFDSLCRARDRSFLIHSRSRQEVRLKGEVLREAERHADASDAYLETIERLKKNTRLEEEVRDRFLKQMKYTLSGIYVDLKQIDKAAEQLEGLLKDDPDNPTFLNDLGFIWADHDMKFDEAEKLIRKAIDKDREQRKKIEDLPKDDDVDSAAYLDSLGWVLFKKKNYKEAKEWLEKATKEKDGQHVEILDHLGDTHLALGEKEQAVAAWEKALKATPQGKRDEQRKEEVKKKLEEHKK